MKKISKLLVVSSLALILVACGGTNSSSKKTSSNTKVEQKINVTSSGSLTTLDSALYDDVYSSDNIGQAMEGLYRLDKNNEPELGIAAAEPTVSSDKTVYTFKLRDAKWSNGDPVVADDFVYAFQNVADPSYGSQNSDSMDVFKNGAAFSSGNADKSAFGVKALDDKTLELTLEHPITYLKKLLTGTRFLPKDAKFAQKVGKKYGTSADMIVSNGPFLISGWNGTNDSWTLTKNKNYWDAKNVKMEEVKVDVVKEVATGVNLFDSGKTNFTVLTDEYAKQKQGSAEYHSVPKSLIGYLNFNFKRDTTGNVHFRKAIAQAIDKKSFAQNVLADGSTALNGLVPTNFAKDPDSKKEFRSENGSLSSYNLKEAKAEWKKAKAELGKEKVTIEILSADTSIAKKTVEFLQGELEKNLSGLSINVRSVPIGQRLDLNRAGDYDIFFGTWTPDYADPINFLQPYTTSGGLNFGKYSNTAYDEAINQAMTTYATNPEKRWDTMLAAEKIMIKEDAAIVPVYQGSIAYLKTSDVKDIQTFPFGRSVSYRLSYVK